MREVKIITAVVLLAVVCSATADVIHLKNGNRIEAEGVTVAGEKVVFTVFGGQMSIDLLAVERIERSDRPVAANAGLRNAVSGIPFRDATGAATTGAGTGEGGEGQAQNSQELVQFYISQRQQLQKEVRLYEEQIQTLRSVIYAKSAIFEDTETERNRIIELENLKKAADEKLSNIMIDARKAGLSAGDLRAIENARSDALNNQIATVENQRDPRDANVTWIDINNSEEDGRSSDVVLTEDADKSRSTSPEDEEAKKKK